MDNPNHETSKLSDMFKEMLNSSDIIGPLEMPDGRTSASITVETSLPGQSRSKEEYWPFIIPSGYVRHSGKFDTDRHSGDSAHCDWSNNNPTDGTVYARVKCSQVNGYARAAASNVYAIKVKAAERLYKLSLEEK